MELQLEQLDYQRRAIDSVVHLFNGQTRNTFDNSYFLEIQTNTSDLGPEQFQQNLRNTAGANGIPENIARFSPDADICVEMETGTGKTLVYIRTAFELYKHHGFTKFIILVPSVAIRAGVVSTLETFGPQLEALYGFRVHFFEYDSRKLPQVRDFISNPHPQIMVMTLQSFTTDDKVVNRPGRDDAVLGLSYLDAIGSTRPILIMDEPQEGMDTPNAKQRLRVRTSDDSDPTPTLNPLIRLRYSATHIPEETRNLVYRLTPFDAYAQGLVKKIEVLSVAEKNDEATFKLELATIENGKGEPKAKLRAWRLSGGEFKWGETPWLKPGDQIAAKTKNPSYRDYTVEKVWKQLGSAHWRVRFTNGVELVENERSGDRAGIFRQQLHWLIRRHFQKKLGLDQAGEKVGPGLTAQGVKCLSLVFIDRVDKYTEADGLIRRIFEEEYRALAREYVGIEPSAEQVVTVHNGYFAKTNNGEYTDNASSIAKNKQAFEDIVRSRTALLALDHPVEFIFSHSALGVGWDNPNVFNIATLNESYSDIKKRQEIGRGLRICRDHNGRRLYDLSSTPEGRELNLLTVIPNETYETFALQYQEQIRETYGDEGQGAKLRHTHKGRPKAKKVRRRKEVFESDEFRAFWNRLAQRTRYIAAFDEVALLQRSIEELDQITVPEYRAQVSLDRVTAVSTAGLTRAHVGTTDEALRAVFTPLDLVEELSEQTSLAYTTAARILAGISNRGELVKNPARWLQQAVQLVQRIEREEMLRILRYEPTGETVPFTAFVEALETYRDTEPTPRRGLYDHALCDSQIERGFAFYADTAVEVVCFLKLPDDYVIPVPGHKEGYRPDWGLVLRHRRLREGDEQTFEFVVETKGTDDLEDTKTLTEDERWKIKCARKHFRALGIPASFIAPVRSWESFLKRTPLA